MLSPEDPRLVAYASGDLSTEEVARLEEELAASPEARIRLAELVELQTELKAALAAEARAEERLVRDATVTGREKHFISSRGWTWLREVPAMAWGNVASACFVVLFLGALLTPTVGSVRETAHRTVVSSNLRQIGQASLIVASDHQDILPSALAKDLHDYARIAARDGGLDDATIWMLATDPASSDVAGKLGRVLASDKQELDPVFARLKSCWAVALHPDLTTEAPSTTPIAWTRGLQPDGTWAAHSPNGTAGGHVVFLGGNVSWYQTTKDAFVRLDGGRSSNVLDALPPGARIAEYVPTPLEAEAWARAYRIQVIERDYMPFVWVGLGGALGLVLWVQGRRRRWSYLWFQLYLILSCIVAVVVSATC